MFIAKSIFHDRFCVAPYNAPKIYIIMILLVPLLEYYTNYSYPH